MIFDQTVTAFTQQTKALIGQLTKAEAWCTEQGIDEGELLETRLAPDMFPLGRQLDFVTAQLLQPMRRLTGRDLPDPPPDPPEASRSLAAHKQRLSASIVSLADLSPSEVDGNPARMIAMDLPNGMAFDLSAADYVRDWAVPQFYFHLMAAYTILRYRGVPLGKADFVPHMMRHLRKAAS